LTSEFASVSDSGEIVFEQEGERLCLINTRIMMLRDGQVIFHGSDEALKKSEDAYIRRFMRGR
jgi:ABC-type transporter Mla maintaining outer membrane lipid asymmetry ATPase subunit MlaF